VAVDLVAALTRAMYQRKQISATYASLENGASERILSPVALVHDGLRWHIRCFNHAKERFTDFNLARFHTVAEGGPSEKSIDQDPEWTKEVAVILEPHPKAEHPETIRFDYDMDGDTKTVTMSLCLVPYFLRHWHIDTTPKGTKNPKEHQLFLLNRQELLDQRVSAWVFDDDVTQ
jgi:predicted DNA-binding transcriptional regulator YafY